MSLSRPSLACAAAFVATAGLARAGTLTPDLAEQLEGAGPTDLARVIVMLPDQLDQPAFVAEMGATGATLHRRHVEAVTRLQALSSERQEALLERLQEGLMIDEVADYTPLWITNGVIVTATRREIESIARRADVDLVYPDYPISLIAPVGEPRADDSPPAASATTGAEPPATLAIEEGVSSTRAPELWALGFDGTGVIVGDMDTGADGDHPAFANRYLGLRKPTAQCWFDPVTHTTFPEEFGYISHGTHTLGTICGSDGSNQIGMAPGAEWIAAAVIDRVSLDRTIADAILAFEWFADPDGDPFTSDDVPAAVNNSWGVSPIWHGVPHCDNTFWNVIDNCEAAGAAVIFAAGNEGPGSKSLRTPADRIASSTNVFSVGALMPGSSEIASFSSRGPSGCDNVTIKPEVTARGYDVRSSVHGGGYGTLSGTSMACPHVAGAIALLRSARPQSSPEELKEALLMSAVDLGSVGEDNTYGTGRIDVVAALDFLGGPAGIIKVDLDPIAEPVRVPTAGGPVVFDWEVRNEGGEADTFDTWLTAAPEWGGEQLVWGPEIMTLDGGDSTTGTATAPMRGYLPNGYYWASALVGEYPDDAVDSDSFQIYKGDTLPFLLTFDELADDEVIGDHYAGVTFSPGWMAWNSVGNTRYPPHSVPNVAYTHEQANSIAWSTPVDELRFYASGRADLGLRFHYSAYDSTGTLLERITTTGGKDRLVQFSAAAISELVVTGTGVWYLHHTIDDLAYALP